MTLDALIESDGKTVWVTMPTGMTVGRFGPTGVDIHLPDASGCLDCTHAATGAEEWKHFVAGMKREHGVDVGGEWQPAYTKGTT